MTPTELAAAVQAAVAAAGEAGELSVPVPEKVLVERPRQREHGDYATNVALQLAKPAGKPPRAVAETLAVRLRAVDGIAEVEVAGPGFLNFRLASGATGELARAIALAGPEYGRGDTLAKLRVNLEFVSANPTGPVHLGHTRWAAVGDSLHRILEAADADVVTEHYLNDAGSQMEKFGESLLAAITGGEIPDGGYSGDYVVEVADRIAADAPSLVELPKAEAIAAFREAGYHLMLGAMQESLRRFGVEFDVWFSERSLHSTGAVERALDELRRQGHVYDADGAVWLRTTDFGDDKDRVLVRSNGDRTYLASDAAYYINKRERGFDKCIFMLGADHHGYVGRLKAIAACAGDDPDSTVEVLVGQLVNLVRDGQPVRLSKRAGTIVTLDDLIDAVGVDAARYSLARASTDSPLTLDLDVITRQSSDNPVWYVQYVHARNASIARTARDMGIAMPPAEDVDVHLLTHDKEQQLLLALAEFPRIVASAAELRAPHRIAHYLEEIVAPAYHRFYDECRALPQGDEAPSALTYARLLLCEATRVVVANGLSLLGVSAPDRM